MPHPCPEPEPEPEPCPESCPEPEPEPCPEPEPQPDVYRSASLVGSSQASTEVVCEVDSDEAARCVADLKEKRRRSIQQLSSSAVPLCNVMPPVESSAVGTYTEVSLPVAHATLKARRRRSVAAINRSASRTPGPVEVDVLPTRARRLVTGHPEPSQAPASPSRAPSPPAAPPTKQLEPTKERKELTAEQAAAVAAATAGANVFITGEAGTGKTEVLGSILDELTNIHGSNAIFVTASTGHAASQLRGSCSTAATTVHSFAGVGIADRDPNFYRSNPPAAAATKRWRQAKVLVIDEISMLGGRMFDTLEAIATTVREDDHQAPFAGLQLIVAGDFFQLPPVGAAHAFEADAWRKANFENHVLRDVHRQRDQTLKATLSQLRVGELQRSNHEWLMHNCSASLDESDGILATRLYATNEKKDDRNDQHLQQLSGPVFEYIAEDSGTEDELRHCRARKLLQLKVGAQVVCLRNLPSMGLVNGSRGVVMHLEKDAAVVKFYNIGLRTMKKMSMPGHRRRQLPLDLAWALTIHSSQGMTLDKVVVDLTRTFAPGMAYTALSRSRSTETLQVVGVLQQHVDTKVLAFMNSIGGSNSKPLVESDDGELSDASSESGDSWASAVESCEEMDVRAIDNDLLVVSALPNQLRTMLLGVDSFLVQYLVHVLVDQGFNVTADHCGQLQTLQTEDRQVKLLQQLAPGNHWVVLPSDSSTISMSFAADVVLSHKSRSSAEAPIGTIQFELQWPKIAHQRLQRRSTGYTKRAFLRYGAENLFTVTLPSGKSGSEIASQFRGRTLQLCGLNYNLLCCKPGSKDSQMVFIRQGLHSGCIDQAIDEWHLDLRLNPTMPLLKALSRSKLAFSSIVPTVIITPDQLVLEDLPVLEPYTDGCCGIGAELFETVWSVFREATNTVDDGVLPSAFQGRLGSLKGVWYLDRALSPHKIAYRASMHKFHIDAPTVEQLRIEVCCFALDLGPSRLNKQAVQVLKDRVADPAVFEQMFSDGLVRKSDILTSYKSAEEFCRSSQSGELGQKVLDKMHAGFELQHELVQGLLVKAIKWSADRDLDELHLPLPKSRTAIILPDIIGALCPDEIINLTPRGEPMVGPTVVFRNPVYDPAECLHLTAVDPLLVVGRLGTEEERVRAWQWYRDQKNCAIFSTQPDCHGRPVVEAMQGADFDGDTATVIWDPRIVHGFRPAPGGDLLYSDPVLAPTQTFEECEQSGAPLSTATWQAFTTAVEQPEQIGQISKLHERWAAHPLSDSAGNLNQAGKAVRALADMVHKALDARTAGYLLQPIPQDLWRAAPSAQYGPVADTKVFDREYVDNADATSLFGRMWLLYAEFLRNLRSSHGEGGVPFDPDIESLAREHLESARARYQEIAQNMAMILRELQEQPEQREVEMRKIKLEERTALEAMPSSQRDAYASAWYTIMRERHTTDLDRWLISCKEDNRESHDAPW